MGIIKNLVKFREDNMLIKLPVKKYALQSIRSIYGINNAIAKKVVAIFGLHPQSSGKIKKRAEFVNDVLSPLKTGFRLKLVTFSRMCVLLATNSYRGLRMLQGLPTKGQRTHANGKSLRNLQKAGKFFPFKITKRRDRTVAEKWKGKKGNKSLGTKTKNKKQKLTAKQKAKVKAKNKAKAKAKKKG